MACDMFSPPSAFELLKYKRIYFFGSSNIRALYKDLLWLLQNGSLIPEAHLKTKNEKSYANDVRVSNGELHGGCDYEEVREYTKDCAITFQFITRLYLPGFINTIKNLKHHPDVVIISSCVWDLSRWGSNGVDQFKKNLVETFGFLKDHLPNTRIIWLSTFPPAFTCRGGFLTKETEFVRNMLPWHVVCANKFASDTANLFKIDVLDVHYRLHFLLNNQAPDGIHWNPLVVRYITNLLLTHIALVSNYKLPGVCQLDQRFLVRSQKFYNYDMMQQHNNYGSNRFSERYFINRYNTNNIYWNNCMGGM